MVIHSLNLKKKKTGTVKYLCEFLPPISKTYTFKAAWSVTFDLLILEKKFLFSRIH